MNRKMNVGVLVLLVGISLGPFAVRLFNRLTGPPVAAQSVAGGAGYVVGPQFESGPLNSRMLTSRDFQLSRTDSLPQVVAAIRQRFRPNRNPNVVVYGNAAHVPVGWAFVALTNTTRQTQMLVLTMPQYRCSRGATLFVGRGNPGHEWHFDSVGTVGSTTPLGERFFPSFNLAFPVTLPPRATIPLLLRTESRVGSHEVDVWLFQRAAYAGTALMENIRNGAQVIICLLLALVALLIGWRSGNRLMLAFGGYLLSLTGTFSNYFGYLQLPAYPDWTSVNAETLGTVFRLVIGFTIHPFFYEVIKPAIRHRRLYIQAVVAMGVVRLVFIGLHLMPYQYYHHINYVTNLAMTGLDTLSIVWLVYFSILAWYRARIWSMLVVCLLVFIPGLLSQIFTPVQTADGQSVFQTPTIDPLLLIIALSYIAFEQFRKEVITRQLLDRQVRQVRQDINALRRQEIEGIGRDLHDQVGNTLATALGYLSRLPTETEKPRAIIVNAIRELRFLSHNLVKDDDRPLTDKVETLVSRINDFSAIAISFADYSKKQIDTLPTLTQQNLYSIIQELLTNVIRHSQATQASVQFFYDGTSLDVSVEDDGIGFDLLAAKADKGIGIQNIYKRAALSGIDVMFDAAPNGTSVLLKTPLYDSDPNDTH